MPLTTEVIAKTVGEVKSASAKRKFNQSVDLAVNLKELDMSKPENRLNEEIVLPHGRGKALKVAIIATGELALQAKSVADRVLSKEEIEELAKDKKTAKKLVNEFDFFVAQADLMPLIGRTLGTVMGPRGKMPKPVPVNAPIALIVEKLRKTVRLRTKEKPVLHVAIGTEDMPDEKLAENAEAILKALERKLEKGLQNIRSIYLKTTMGKALKLEVA